MSTAATVGDLALRQLSTGYTGPPPARPWLPPLRNPTALNTLINLHEPQHLSFPVGVVDLPFRMAQKPWTIPLGGMTPSLAIGGAPQMGKSTFLQTVSVSTAWLHSPIDVQIMALDFNAGKLVQLNGLPHVLAVASKTDIPRIVRIFGEIARIRAHRQHIINTHQLGSWDNYRRLRQQGQIDDPYGDVLFIIDGWDTFAEGLDSGQPNTWVPETMKNGHQTFMSYVRDILSGGANQGIHSLIATTRWGALRDKYRNYLPLKIDLAPADANDLGGINNRAVHTIPEIPGRGLASNALDLDGLSNKPVHQHVMVAAPRLDGLDSMNGIDQTFNATIAAIADRWRDAAGPAKLALLPPKVHLSQLLKPVDRDNHGQRWTIPVGLLESTITPLHLNLAETPNILIFGDKSSGKTTAARSIAQAIVSQNSPEQVRFVVVSFNAHLYGAVPDEYLLRPDMFIRNPTVLHNIFADKQQLAPPPVFGEPSPQAPAPIPGLISALQSRRIPEGITPAQSRKRDWWSKKHELVILIDDWHIVQPQMDPTALAGLAGLNQYIQMPDTGVHLIATCQSANASTATSYQGVVAAAWNMGSPTFWLSGNDEHFFSKTITITKRDPGRASYIQGNSQVDVVQMAYKEAAE